MMSRLLLILLVSSASACATPVEYWTHHMVRDGERYCESGDNYYDAVRVYYQIAQYTGESRWDHCAEVALHAYVDGYLAPNGYKAAGWMIFPHGLSMHLERTGDGRTKDALVNLAANAAFADHSPAEWLRPIDTSREVAYNIQSKLLAESAGYTDRAEVQRLVDLALGHYDQWFVSRTAPYLRPFMAALTAEALILWYDKTGDPRVLPALKTGADWMWEHLWVSSAGAFKYTDRIMPHGGVEPAPDLNLLIAPLYGWLYKMTGEETYRQHGDEIFAGGVQDAYLNDPKHFNQNYRWSFEYLRWRGNPSRNN
jgi:hypothetical protein